MSLLDKLEQIYQDYGYCLNTLHSYEFDGSAGMEKMNSIMSDFHKELSSIAGYTVVKTEDYSVGLDDLPKSDVLKYYYHGPAAEGSVVIRPSGTEPKPKAYISVTAADRHTAEIIEHKIVADIETRL